MPSLHSELRRSVDWLDMLSACAACARLGVASRIGDVKRAAGVRALDLARERAVTQTIGALWGMYGGERTATAPRRLWRVLMRHARAIEPECLALHLGPMRTHSDRATARALRHAQRLPSAAFGEACSRACRVGGAIIPVLNTLSGPVRAAVRICRAVRGLLTARCTAAVRHAFSCGNGRRHAHSAVAQPHALVQCSAWAGGSRMVSAAARSAAAAPSISAAAHGAGAITTPALALAMGRRAATPTHSSAMNRTTFAICARGQIARAVHGSRTEALAYDARCGSARHCAALMLAAIRHWRAYHDALWIDAAAGESAYASARERGMTPLPRLAAGNE
ncbi:prephenate dehydratase [Candidatus Tremblaya princeps]|uniref:Prephenate dehydratase n=1 Tax=Tremblaya princeps TaxID=189385 RepID=A0A143WNI8_TREPR|nr:prephenate dehydratase [Candidatus Tremblaya princeps]